MAQVRRSGSGSAALAAITAAVLLVGCSPQLPGKESFETAIPKALIASDLGITDASAEKNVSGFALTLSVHTVFDRDSVTAEEFSELLSIVVATNNLSNPAELRVSGRDGTTSEPDAYISLAAVGEGLGFPLDPDDRDPYDFDASWDDVLEFVSR